MSKENDIVQLIILESERIVQAQDYSKKSFLNLFNLFSLACEELTTHEHILFPTLFSRLSYIASKNKISSNLIIALHTYRRVAENIESHRDEYDLLIENAMFTLHHFLTELFDYSGSHFYSTQN